MEDNRKSMLDVVADFRTQAVSLLREVHNSNSLGTDKKEMLVVAKIAEADVLSQEVDNTIAKYRIEQGKGGISADDDISSLLFKNAADKLEQEKPKLVKLKSRLQQAL